MSFLFGFYSYVRVAIFKERCPKHPLFCVLLGSHFLSCHPLHAQLLRKLMSNVMFGYCHFDNDFSAITYKHGLLVLSDHKETSVNFHLTKNQ